MQNTQEFKKGPSEEGAKQITQMLGFYPKTLAEMPTILADSVCKNIKNMYGCTAIAPPIKTIIQFAIAVAQEDKFRKNKNAMQAKVFGYTEEDLAYIAEAAALLAKFTTFDLLLNRTEEELNAYKQNYQQCVEYIKKSLNLPNSYDKSKISKPKSNFFGLTVENETKAIQLFGVVPYNLNEMPSAYANFAMERMLLVFQYLSQKIPLKERMLILFAVANRLHGGQSEPIKHYISEVLKVGQVTNEEMADLAASQGLEAFQSMWVKYTEWDFQQYKLDWSKTAENMKKQIQSQQEQQQNK